MKRRAPFLVGNLELPEIHVTAQLFYWQWWIQDFPEEWVQTVKVEAPTYYFGQCSDGILLYKTFLLKMNIKVVSRLQHSKEIAIHCKSK